MKNHLVQLASHRQLAAAIKDALTREVGFGRIILVEGGPGRGKTTVAKALAKKFGGAFVRAGELVTALSLLTDISISLLGWSPKERRTHEVFARCVSELCGCPTPLAIIDEADRLCRSGGRHDLLQLCRDLSDESGAVVVLISVRRLAQRLAKADVYDETITTRLAAQIKFAPPSLADARLLAAEALADGSLRPLLGLFAEIERVARAAGIERLDLARWQEITALTAGKPTTVRRQKNLRADADGDESNRLSLAI